MPNTLLTKGQEATTSLVTMYTATSDTMIFQILCANKSATLTPTIKVVWNDGVSDITLIDNYAIPIGSMESIIENAKKLLNTGDTLKIQSSDNSAVDVTIDYVEIT